MTDYITYVVLYCIVVTARSSRLYRTSYPSTSIISGGICVRGRGQDGGRRTDRRPIAAALHHRFAGIRTIGTGTIHRRGRAHRIHVVHVTPSPLGHLGGIVVEAGNVVLVILINLAVFTIQHLVGVPGSSAQSKLWRFWMICQDLFESLILYLAGLALKALIA